MMHATDELYIPLDEQPAHDLQRYSPQAIRAAADRFQEALQRGAVNAFEALVELRYFRFRDADGAYWMVDARDGTWYRCDDGAWAHGEPPGVDLEGEAGLAWSPPLTPDQIDERMAALFGAKAEYYGEAPEILAALVNSLKEAYQQGALPSSAVEDLAAQQFVVDREGRPWLVGLRSLDWYQYDDGDWVRSGEAPKPEDLVRLLRWPETCPKCGEAQKRSPVCPACGEPISPEVDFETDEALGAFQAFILFGMGSIPEPVTGPWNPPPGYPDLGLAAGPRCRACGAVNPAGSRFCNQCATALGCLQCGAINRLADRFCTQCGAELPALQFEP